MSDSSPPPQQPPTVWIDCTHTVKDRFRTGVQRVVRFLCSQAMRKKMKTGQEFQPIIAIDGNFFNAAMDDSDASTLRLSNQPLRWRDDVVAHLPQTYRTLAAILCDRVNINILRRWLLPLPGHSGVFKTPIKIAKRFEHNPPPDAAAMQAGDVLLLPDAYWLKQADWDAIGNAKASGLRLVFILYDLIPHTHCQLYDEQDVAAFRFYLSKLIELADQVIAISETVAAQFRLYISQQESSQQESSQPSPEVTTFRLGAQVQAAPSNARRSLRQRFENANTPAPYLMVGSIEIRKNHHYVLDALEQVWKTKPWVQLLVIGRTGWQGKSVVQRMERHPRFNQQLFILHDVDDAELGYCYAKARGVFFPSLTEGFGLPIVEALFYRTQPFVSDIEIHREVCGDACMYCRLDDVDTLVQQILAWEDRWGKQPPVIPPGPAALTWEQSFDDLMQAIETHFAKYSQQ